MKLRHLVLASILIAGPLTAERAPKALVEAELINAGGTQVGIARIYNRQDGSVLEVEAHGLPPGPHGLHLHMVGQCQGPEFASAGAHLNPEGHEHGIDNPLGSHLGDLPNVTAGADGRIKATIRTPMRPFKLVSTLMDGDGTAIVIHAGPDDYRTDPSGNSGARIACGVFARN